MKISFLKSNIFFEKCECCGANNVDLSHNFDKCFQEKRIKSKKQFENLFNEIRNTNKKVNSPDVDDLQNEIKKLNKENDELSKLCDYYEKESIKYQELYEASLLRSRETNS